MSFHTPQDVAEMSIDAGTRNSNLPLMTMLILGFLAGAFIAIRYLLDIRVTANVPKDWGSFTSFLGGAVFPVGLMLVAFVAIGFQHVVANMFVIPASIFAGHVTWADWFRNFVPVFLGNAVGGGIFVAVLYWLSYIRPVKQGVK